MSRNRENKKKKSKRSPRFRIHHLCMLHFNWCLFRSRKSKKKIKFALQKNLKTEKFSISSHKTPQKDTIQIPETPPSFHVCYKLRISSIGCVCKRSRRPCEGRKFTRKLNLIWKKNCERLHILFLLNNTKDRRHQTAIIMYLTHNPFKDSLFINSNRLGLITVVKNEQNSQIYEF